ncbi:MAG: hypothetical protein ABSA96_03095 [Candidatus Acidiferrales bacterium]
MKKRTIRVDGFGAITTRKGSAAAMSERRKVWLPAFQSTTSLQET